MKNKFAVITAALALLYIGSATAAEQPENKQPAPTAEQSAPVNPDIGFGGGMNIGAGGGAGSPVSLTGSPGSPAGNSGSGTQTFGGGLPGTSPLSTPPAAVTGGAGAMGGAAGAL